MFKKIKRKAAALKKFNQDKVLTDILDNDILKAQIVDLNQKQLYEQGLQADGTPTGDYHPITIAHKLKYGDARGIPGRIDHITGLDTGMTYDSMEVVAKEDGIVVRADDHNDFFEIIDRGLGLTKESLSEIRPEIKSKIIDEVKKAIRS